jgi:sigma-B regulation protein RsbQ
MRPEVMHAVLRRNNVHLLGRGTRTIVLAHGFGCDQNMWRLITPPLTDLYRVVLFDYTGAGHSDTSQYCSEKYSTLKGYAADLIEIIEATSAAPAIFVGHSVSSMIGALAAVQRPELFDHLVMIGALSLLHQRRRLHRGL